MRHMIALMGELCNILRSGVNQVKAIQANSQPISSTVGGIFIYKYI